LGKSSTPYGWATLYVPGTLTFMRMRMRAKTVSVPWMGRPAGMYVPSSAATYVVEKPPPPAPAFPSFAVSVL
jgi:hypothetical protein